MDLKNKDLLKSGAYVNGKWIKGDKTFVVTNPATGEKIADVADLSVSEVTKAIEQANAAFKSWRKTTAKERGKILRKWHDLIMDNQDDLALILTTEQGKPLAESKGEIAYAAAFFEWFGEEGKRAYGDIIPSPIANSRIVVEKQPVGVCASITPWNFPSAMITRKVGPALAAGCSILCRPAAETPLSATALAVLAEKAGVPAGVFNVITSSDSKGVGKEFCTNKTVRKLSFTGSTGVGKILMKQSAETLQKLSLELGGNAPFIVFDDADIEAAAEAAIACKYRNAGQTCVCANRLYIHESIYEEFTDIYLAKVKAMKVGDGTKEGVNVGPMINDSAIEKVQELLQDAKDKGGDIIVGGNQHKLGKTFFEPTIVKNATKDMKFAKEEIFGPVAPLFKFSSDEEVIEMANDTEYGLAAYFFSKDLSRVWNVAEELEYGMVAVNTGILSTEVAPFGGVKESGFGREGSKYGLDEYLETKYILMSGIK